MKDFSRRRIQICRVEDEHGRLKHYRLRPYQGEGIEVFVTLGAIEPIEIKCSHRVTEETLRSLIATSQRALKVLRS